MVWIAWKLIEFFTVQTLALELELNTDEIQTLANKISATLSNLDNVEMIISNTRNDLERVENLKQQANATK